jgi:Mg2+/citrate symporter
MRKGKITKAVALVSIAAILSLSAPGLFAGETSKLFIGKMIKSPVMFLYSLFYFTPIYNIDKYVSSPAVNKKEVKQIKVSGGLDIDRPSRGD